MNDKNATLKALVDRAAQHQRDLKLSDNAFCAQYLKFVGSPKTWADRLKAGAASGSFAEMNLDKWIGQLSVLVREIDGQVVGDAVVEDLPITRYALAMFRRLQGTDTDRRVAWLIGDYGVGKSWALRYLHRKNPGTTALLEADENWRENKGRIVRGIAQALHVPMANGTSELFDAVVDHLNANRITLLIDEMHHGGVMMMKLLKSLVNKTSARVICGTYPTALRALETSSSDSVAEARQILGRSVKPIDMRWATGLGVDDVTAFLKHAADLDGRCRGLALRITPLVSHDGNFRQLADALENARIEADSTDAELTDDLFEEHVRALSSRTATKIPGAAQGKGGAR